MNNTINNLSFKANLRTLTKIKNKSAFSEVNDLFKKSTKNNKDDVLLITKTNLGENVLQLSHLEKGIYKDYINADVVVKDINKQIDTIGASKFSQKIVSIYKALKAHEKAVSDINGIKIELSRAKSLLNLNQSISYAWASEGKEHIAKRYDVLAQKNTERIEFLTKKLNTYVKEFNKKIDKLCSNYRELEQLKI